MQVDADQRARREGSLPFPAEVRFPDLADLIEGFVPTAQGTDDDPTIASAWFDLVPDWRIGEVEPKTPEYFAGEDGPEELAYWNELAFALTYPESGEVVAPLVIDADAARAGARVGYPYPVILDGYIRATLAVGVGRSTLAAYVRRIGT